ncbi:MAG: hypothetical protein HY906_14270 [Deltaproteobacteria bacterium]|nr:hypothetical protein [Deltaproteobacteria bacterium]
MSRVENADVLLEDAIRMMEGGQAEHAPLAARDFFERFLPVSRHLRVLDPQVRLVIGDKGAGKSQLFQALKFPEGQALLTKLASDQGQVTLPLERVDWRVGFETLGTFFPSPPAFGKLKGRPVEDSRLLWTALLARALRHEIRDLGAALPVEYHSRLTADEAPNELGVLVDATRTVEGQLITVLDKLEHRLAQTDRYAVVTYDELDRVSPGDWEVIRILLQGLIQFWSVYLRRWQRIVCKIFLRRDLYERAAFRGPDIAKIAWNPAELSWTPGDLYRLLFKRLANAGDSMRDYLRGAKLRLDQQGLLGWIPEGVDERDFVAPVKYVFGEYMGSDPRRGLTLRWIPNHLKDGRGRIFPRSLLRFIEEAAKIEKRQQAASRPRLVHHSSLRGGLDEVSPFRVWELVNEEFPWLQRIEQAFKADPFRVPAERKLVLRALTLDWSGEPDGPPLTEPEALLGYLEDLGIASVRSGGKIDVGDLYLLGMHLKRRGGVARPRL